MLSPEHRGLRGLRIVVIDPDSDTLYRLAGTLRAAGHFIFSAYDGESALALLNQYPGLELLIAKSNPEDLDIPELIRLAREINPALPILHIGEAPDIAVIPSDVTSLPEPCSSAQLLRAVATLMEGKRISKQRDRRQHSVAPPTIDQRSVPFVKAAVEAIASAPRV